MADSSPLLTSRWLRWRGAKPAVEVTIVLAVAYLSFYVGQSPAKVGRAGTGNSPTADTTHVALAPCPSAS